MSANPKSITPTLAEKIDTLFHVFRRPDGREWSPDAVATAMTEAGDKISGVYIHTLRTGRKDNPTKKHLESLARFFGVDVSYFYDDSLSASQLQNDLKVVAAMRSPAVKQVALRAEGLSPEAHAHLRGLLDYMRARENLPSIE